MLSAIASAMASALTPAVLEATTYCRLLKQLDSAVGAYSKEQDTTPIISACHDLCRAFTGAAFHSPRPSFSGDQLQHTFFEADVWHLVLEGLSAPDQLLDAASAASASARFILLPSSERTDVLDQLAAAVVDDEFLRARCDALNAARLQRLLSADATRGPAFEDEERIVAALFSVAEQYLGPGILTPLGFPASRLGLQCLAAAALWTGSLSAAASLGRVFHAADAPAPLLLRPATVPAVVPAIARSASTPPQKPQATTAAATTTITAATAATAAAERTLVVAFSSLGWHGLIRAEWGGTLRALPTLAASSQADDADDADDAAADDNTGFAAAASVDVAHALDTSASWFCTNPISGEFDDGAWWDAALAELAVQYDKVCFVGESMGASAALRFARHATGAVVALAPQIDLRDFGCCGRADFPAKKKVSLREAIVRACTQTSSQVVLHVGRDADDLAQLSYLPGVADAYAQIGAEAEDPLVRDGVTSSLALDVTLDVTPDLTLDEAVSHASSHVRVPLGRPSGSRLRIVKHDIESHAVGAGLQKKGTLRETVLGDLLIGSNDVRWVGTAQGAG